jgi:hypothetical protein
MPEPAAPFAADGEDGGAGAEISARVSAVFTAAEKAAQHMLTMAREEADDIRRRAQTHASCACARKSASSASASAGRTTGCAKSRPGSMVSSPRKGSTPWTGKAISPPSKAQAPPQTAGVDLPLK